MTFLPSKSEDADHSNISKAISPQVEENRAFKKVKHVFEIKIKELKNIPILDKLIKDINNDKTAISTLSHKKSKVQKDYIQNVAVKYSFPLDDDEVFQSDYIQLNSDSLTENN
jgi:Zn/Cd-binding protein ZinT